MPSSPPHPTQDAGATVGDVGEAALINRIRRRVPPAPDWVATGIGDDAAVVEPARGTLDVVTTDTLVEGIHFERSFFPAADLGHKTLAVNLSDLAAMGATPRVAVLSLVLPAGMAAADLDSLVDGMLALATRHRVALVGGNITRSPGPLVLGMTAIGAVRRRRVLTRGGGRPGDELWVTGTLGAATAGLACLRLEPTGSAVGHTDLAGCVERYRRPDPRVRIGMLLGRNRAASAAVDLSDGLGDGVRQLALASGVGAILDASAVPIDEGARRWFQTHDLDPLDTTLAGGDDYELLVAVPRAHRRRFAAISRLARGVPTTRIGVLTKDPSLVLRTADGERALPGGYQHFQETGDTPQAR
jgi:thiamine-monophosphate kinase|tara:strand:+ start:1779 stop:2852 length:1074 start_codon:yes stop_codon:yes gene_type:complete